MIQSPTTNGLSPDFKSTHRENALQKRCVTVIMSTDKTQGVMKWRCFNCGHVVFEYYNFPKGVFDGAIKVEDCEKPTDHLCRTCNIIFRVT